MLHCSPPCAICLNLFNQSYSIITFPQLAQSCSICPIICIFNFRNFNALFHLSQLPQLAQQFPFFVQAQLPLLLCSVRFSSLVHLSSILFIILGSSSSDIVASSCWVQVLLKFLLKLQLEAFIAQMSLLLCHSWFILLSVFLIVFASRIMLFVSLSHSLCHSNHIVSRSCF